MTVAPNPRREVRPMHQPPAARHGALLATYLRPQRASVALPGRVATFRATWLGESVGWTATNALRADLTRHCLGLDLTFHKDRTPGELIERIDGDVTALATFFSQLVIQVLGNILLAVGILV